MGEKSTIQWTEASWNPWHGCKKVSEGCKYCYMYRDKEKYGQDPTLVVKSKTKFTEPLKWKDPKVIFTCSWSDWFIDEADEWRPDAWKVIKATPHHTYQILTKRPERILDHLPDDWGSGYPNVWLGVSVENKKAADERIPLIVEVPAAIRFLSVEPLLGPVELNGAFAWPHGKGVDWVIVGGESGNDNGHYKYRPMKLEWVDSIIEQCSENAPLFVKQLGTYQAKQLGLKDRHGGNIDEWPEKYKIREFPVI